MIKNPDQIQQFEKELIKIEKTDLAKNFRLIEAMYREAVELGIFPLKNPLDGLEIDLKIAQVVNCVSGTPNKNSNRT